MDNRANSFDFNYSRMQYQTSVPSKPSDVKQLNKTIGYQFMQQVYSI